MKKYNMKKQAGLALMELLIALVILGVASAGYAFLRPSADFQAIKKQVTDGVDLIVADSRAYTSGANFNEITDISVLCNAGYLNEIMCGSSNDGKGTNPFGGDWTVAPSSSLGAAHLSVGVTGIPDNRFNELANDLAKRSYYACQQASSCSSASLTTPSSNSSDGVVAVDI